MTSPGVLALLGVGFFLFLLGMVIFAGVVGH